MASGGLVATHTPDRNSEYRWVRAGKVGKKFAITGAMKPAAKGQKVVLQQQMSGKWKTVDDDKLSSSGKYEF